MRKEKKLKIRNNTAEFLIFTRQAGEDGIEVRVEDETVWLTQKLMAALFDVDVRTVSEHLRYIFASGNSKRRQSSGNSGTLPPTSNNTNIMWRLPFLLWHPCNHERRIGA